MKQERWGAFTLVRPDPQIIWPRHDSAPAAAGVVGGRSPKTAPWENWDGFYHRSEQGGGKWEYRRALPEVGAAYRVVLGKVFPAATLVEVKGLLEPGAKVEIEATAALPADPLPGRAP